MDGGKAAGFVTSSRGFHGGDVAEEEGGRRKVQFRIVSNVEQRCYLLVRRSKHRSFRG